MIIEGLGVAARALGVLASAHLIGTAGFILLAGAPTHVALHAWAARWTRSLLPAAAALVLALVAILLAQAAQIVGAQSPGALLDIDLLRGLVGDTRYGHVWQLRVLLAGTMLALLSVARPGRSAIAARPLLVPVQLMAAAVALGAPLTGHAAGGEATNLRVPAHMLHILALSLWLGALPAWMSLVRASRCHCAAEVQAYAARALQRFSRLALCCMAAIVVSGIVVGWDFVDDQGDLFGTRYGLLLMAKLVLLAAVLPIAHRLRADFVPALRAAGARADRGKALRLVGVEYVLALGLLLFGAWLAQTTPALHDQPLWWLPWRLSLAATWPQWPSVLRIFAAGALLVVALLLHRRRAMAFTLAAAALALVVDALTVPAFPDTFRRSEVPYLTESIAAGQNLFEQHCVSCHGRGALGDGAQAASLPRPPADLSQPHTALHTAGDMYWWFSHGIPAGGMPGFADRLDAAARWDLVNFLRAFSQGFEARVLGPQIQPRQPWLGAPLFYFEDNAGNRADLKDLRRHRAVLLAFLDADDIHARRRLGVLDAAQTRLDAAGVQVIGVATGMAALPPANLPLLSDAAAVPVWTAYQLLSRTLADRGDADRIGMPWRHAEFLIDRFGYVRARWIPQDGTAGWDDIDSLLLQASLLQAEPELRPPPDLHIH